MDIQAAKLIALTAITDKAAEIGISGMGVVLIFDPDTPTIFTPMFINAGRMVREPDPNRGPGDKGTHYAAVAWSKICEMLTTGVNSGIIENRIPKIGEFGWPGGVTATLTTEQGKVFKLFAAFSGGTGAEDVEIAQAGLGALVKNLKM